jgi:LysR family transcriptional regulator (chromosome initiation inhibitor)
MLDYKLLKALAMVLDEGGFEKAAVKLHLTQSAVSQRIKLLEEYVGQILLTRTTPPAATTAGLQFLSHYRKVKQLENDLPPTEKLAPEQLHKTLAIGVNADSLGTWFPDVVEKIIKEQNLILDIHVDDQDETQNFLRNGQVCGCISTNDKALQGCCIEKLGGVQYGIYCTPHFAATWFPHGIDLDAVATTPTIQFNRKDNFNEKFFRLLFRSIPNNPPTFYVPSTEIFVDFILRSLCYGVIPHHQSKSLSDAGKLVDLAPSCKITIDLYYHFWNLNSATMVNFTRSFITGSKKALQLTS